MLHQTSANHPYQVLFCHRLARALLHHFQPILTMKTRDKAVFITLKKVMNIFEERSSFEQLIRYVKKRKPEVLYDDRLKNTIPKYYVNLIKTLGELYDTGYENAWKDREKLI